MLFLILKKLEWIADVRLSYLLFGLPTLCQTWCVLPNGFLSPKFSAHLQVAGAHDQERDAVGEHKVGNIVAERINLKKN